MAANHLLRFVTHLCARTGFSAVVVQQQIQQILACTSHHSSHHDKCGHTLDHDLRLTQG
jgi:hypothetical protein